MRTTANNNPKLTAMFLVLGLLGIAKSAAAVVDGRYDLAILPFNYSYLDSCSGNLMYTECLLGSDGAWHSSTFTFGNYPGDTSRLMLDNGESVTGSDGTQRGSPIAGDGYAGAIGLSITNGNISVSSFHVDMISGTATGDFAQYASGAAGMTGSVDTAGNMIFTPTGRMAAISAPNSFFDRPWNIDDADFGPTGWFNNGNTSYNYFTTGLHSGGSHGDVTGSPFLSMGDLNGDGLTDYSGVLVSAGQFGSAWSDFMGAGYYEIWQVNLLSSAVPLPATAWLFGSGLLGLIAIFRRPRQRGDH